MQRGTISEEDIRKVRAATSLLGLFEEVTSVRRSGSSWKALCPFHEERDPSCSIDEADGLFHCFGCGESGDAISFVEQVHHLDFPRAVEWLADRAGVDIEYEETEEGRANRIRHRRLGEAVGGAADWYEQQLLESPEAREARAYLKSRGWGSELVKRFHVGWAPAGGGAVHALRLPEAIALESGLVRRDDSGRTYELFRERIVFPIYDAGGRPVGLAGRIMPGGDGPKYVNFAETALYQKRKVLYGLNWAKKSIALADEVIVCEGYTDRVAFHLAGIDNAVATCGTALTEEHLKILRRFARRIVLAFDADAAGQGAIERLHRWEGTHKVELAVVVMPAGQDPAGLVEAGRASELVEAVAGARPLLGWRLDRLFEAAHLDTPEGRVTAANAAMALLNAHPDVVLRDLYLPIVAERSGIDIESLRPKRSRARRTARPDAARRAAPRLAGPEFEALRLGVQRPEAIAGWAMPQLFADPLARRVYDVLAAAESLQDAMRSADREATSVIAQMAMEPAPGDPSELRVQLISAAASRAIPRVVRDATRPGADAARLLALSAWLRSAVALAGEERDLEALLELEEWLRSSPEPVPDEPTAPPADAPAADEPPPPPDGYYDDYDDEWP